jgi:hypothetical protein
MVTYIVCIVTMGCTALAALIVWRKFWNISLPMMEVKQPLNVNDTTQMAGAVVEFL